MDISLIVWRIILKRSNGASSVVVIATGMKSFIKWLYRFELVSKVLLSIKINILILEY